MHPCRSWILVGACASWLVPFAAQAVVVYKWVDADGVVHFSDQPVPGAEKITTSGGSTRGILSQPMPGGGALPEEPKPRPGQHASISSPAPDQTFTGGEQVSASLS